jgi:acyl carrier protein
MSDVKETIRNHILAEYLPGEVAANLAYDAPLRSSGIIDSMATLDLVAFLEKEFQIRIEAHDTGVENFDRIEDIAALVARKRA